MEKDKRNKLWKLHFKNQKEAIDFTGRHITKESFTVDHANPNGKGELWNLLPCSKEANAIKADKIMWNDNGITYKIIPFKEARRQYDMVRYQGNGYLYCMVDENNDFVIMAYTKDIRQK